MAATRYSSAALLIILYSLSLLIVTNTQETTSTTDKPDIALNTVEKPETTQETPEQPAVEERQWEPTEVQNTSRDDAPATTESTYPAETTGSSSGSRPKDDFQEELVIRPLHSGDIYGSFQFRTLWETDFMKGNKGEATCSMSQEEDA